MTALEIASACKGCMPLLEAAIHSIRSTLASGQWADEFATLEKLQEEFWKDVDAFSLKTAQVYFELNRYLDVLPYDHTRVKLKPLLKKGINNTYINASWVHCSPATTLLGENSVGERQLQLPERFADRRWKYVVAQGPLPHTCGDFWRMICDNNISLIVMLTGFVENNKVKCAPYFAEGPGQVVAFGKYSILTVRVQMLSGGVVSRLLRVSEKDGVNPTCKEVSHLHLTDWPDHGVPGSASSLLAVCAEARSYRKREKGDGIISDSSNYYPVAVHCSAGIGRSGVFCAVDSVLQSLLALYEDVQGSELPLKSLMDICDQLNLLHIVAHLRRQRGGMVQTADQYAFCYTAVLALLEKVVQMQDC
jgi:protein tyrosine phosphatase